MERQLAAFSAINNGSTSSYPIDPAWYADTAATDHLTNNLDKLTMQEKYHGKDHVQTANGAGMRITHIGQSIIPTLSHPLHQKISFTFPLLLVIFFQLKNLPLITMFSLNFILGIFLLRIGIRERFFLEGVSWRSLQS
jgi:hypothetical protein